MNFLADAPADNVPDPASGVAPAGAPGPRRRRVPAVVWWITALHLSLLLAYSILMPTYRAPDEPLHDDLSHNFSVTFHYPAWNKRDTGVGILNSMTAAHFGHEQHLEAADAPTRSSRRSLEALDKFSRPRGINQLPQHPPLYYAASGTLERGAEIITRDPTPHYDVEAWFYRLVSILFVAPLPLIIWAIGRRLALPRPVGVAACLVPLAIPQYLHNGSAANNDSLMWLFFWVSSLLVLRLADGDVRPSTAALAGLVTGLALYTKGFAIVLPIWVLAGLVISLRRLGRDALGRLTRAGLVYSGVAFVFGGWWWVMNLVHYHQLLPTRYNDLVPPVQTHVRSYGGFFRTWATITTRRFWGDFGWFDVHISPNVVTAATVVVLVGIGVCVLRRDRVAGSPIGDRLLLAAPILLLMSIQFALAFRAYVRLGRMPGLQGRYWFGALAALAVVVALGLANVAPKAIRYLPVAVLAAAVAMNLVGMSTILGF